MRICLLPTDTWGVGSYRCLLPGRELERHGHEVFSYFDQDALTEWNPQSNRPLRNVIPVLGTGLHDMPATLPPGFDADVYVFQRRLEHWMPLAVARLRDLGKTVVSELDDLYDDLPESSPGAVPLREHADVFSVEAFNRSLYFSNLVTVSTPALADHYSQYNPNIRVLPNYLDWEQWENVTPQYEVERPRIRIGWMGWLAWRDTDLEVLREFIRPWLLANRNVEFVSIGEQSHHGKTVHEYLGIPRGQRVTVKGKPFHSLQEILPTIDIGLVPLTFNKFNECKSYLKGLEYAACGIPCIASATEPYRDFVVDGVDGYLARSQRDWETALDSLVNADDIRREMGRAARAKAETLTIQEHYTQWEQAYTQAELSTYFTSGTSTSSKPAPALAT